MYKAVFLDLDDTLLDKNKNISEENKEAIKYVNEKGGMVCIASGRHIESTKKYWNMIDANRYIIYSNGAGIYDCYENENIFLADIEKDICLNLYNYAMQNNVCIRFDTPYGRYITDEKYIINIEILITEEIIDLISNNKILQISILSTEEENRTKVINYINENIPKTVKIENVFMTGKSNEFFAINIVNTNVSKGNAIYGLCKFLKIDINDVIAIGDGVNDISMIKNAGLGVAMENAEPEVKAVAKEITGNCNESGVAQILRSKF